MSIRLNISIPNGLNDLIEENKKHGLKFNISKICTNAIHAKMLTLKNEIKLNEILENLNQDFSGKEIIDCAIKKFKS